MQEVPGYKRCMQLQDSFVDQGSLGESASEATPSGADMHRVSSSSDGSLAALFYPPLPHERSGQAGMSATPEGQIRQNGSSKSPFSAGAAHGESMLDHHSSCKLDTHRTSAHGKSYGE